MKKVTFVIGLFLLLMSACGGSGGDDGGSAALHSALCNDGTYSDSKNCSGTCSHHGGVKVWYINCGAYLSSSEPNSTLDNHSPNSEDADLEIEINTTLTVDLEAVDLDGDEIYFYLDELPNFGTANMGDEGRLTYTPNENFVGVDELSFHVEDEVSSSPSYTIAVTVLESK